MTMTPAQIDQALEAGIITPQQARDMRGEIAKGPDETPASGAMIGAEDEMRFLRSFSDVFIGIGLLILGAGLAALRGMLPAPIGYLIVIAAVYIMAEFFGRRKRAHFPTLILAVLFLIFVRGLTQEYLGNLGATTVTLVAMLGFYWRIRLPFVVALIAVSIIYLVLAGINAVAPDILRSGFGIVLAIMGFAVFAVALLYDINDVERRTRFADNAFWLHLLAAPMIIHGLAFTAVKTKTDLMFGFLPIISIEPHEAVIILTIVAVLCVIGLAINRRALIVSSLGYAGFALVYLAQGAGMEIGTALIAALILLGAGIVLLGVAWHPARNLLIWVLPRWRIFPPAQTEVST